MKYSELQRHTSNDKNASKVLYSETTLHIHINSFQTNELGVPLLYILRCHSLLFQKQIICLSLKIETAKILVKYRIVQHFILAFTVYQVSISGFLVSKGLIKYHLTTWFHIKAQWKLKPTQCDYIVSKVTPIYYM